MAKRKTRGQIKAANVHGGKQLWPVKRQINRNQKAK